MMDMMGGMGVLMLLALMLLGIVIAAGVFLGVRAARGSDHGRESPLEELQGRLARGEVSTEEYYERESVLRGSQTAGRGRR